MTYTIQPGLRHGRITAPASKSMAHRWLIASALLGKGKPRVEIPGGESDDLRATRLCLKALINGDTCMPCGESGTTLRFFIPIAGALGRTVEFVRKGRLASRPLAPFDACLTAHGLSFSEAGEKLRVSGKLTGGVFSLPGNVSSQFFSGLEFAFALMSEPAHYEVVGPLESAAYVAMTRKVIAACRTGDKEVVQVEGDWSNAAFFLAMGVTVDGLDPFSLQGDRAIVNQLDNIHTGGDVTLDVSQTPDAVPALAAAAAIAPNTVVRLVNAARLRLKESDRLSATAAMLNALGARVIEQSEGLVIYGRASLVGGATRSFNDHRLAMAAAVAATHCQKPVVLEGADAVTKSYPRFWEDFNSLRRDNFSQI